MVRGTTGASRHRSDEMRERIRDKRQSDPRYLSTYANTYLHTLIPMYIL
jgi:hypothetical protein